MRTGAQAFRAASSGPCHRQASHCGPRAADVLVGRLQLQASGLDASISYACTGLGCPCAPRDSVEICLDDAGVDREAFAGYESFAHAAPQHALEEIATRVALAEAPDFAVASAAPG